MNRTKSMARQHGFSLVEIMIAVTIVVIMGGVVAVNVFPQLFKSKVGRAEIDIKTLKGAVKMFQLDEGRLPRENEWPDFLANGSENHPDPYVDEDILVEGEVRDPWNNPYQYKRISNRKFDIISYGADGAPGGEGDDADISLLKERE